MTYDEILTYFQVNKRYPDKAQCQCPAHDDKQASLTVTKGRDSVLIHCHAGCGIENVLSAAGLKKSDLFYQEKRTGSSWQAYIESREKKKIEAVYNYVSINGGYIFTKVRMQGKKMIYGTLANERFNYGLGGRTRKELCAVYAPDGVQAINKAISEGKPIFIPEGEKDVDTLTKQGYVAVTAGGVNDWQSDFVQIFKGAVVYILADNDEPGRRVANTIQSDLQGIAKSAKVIVPVPDIPKADISDYFAAGHSKEEFESLLQQETVTEKSTEGNTPDLSQFHLVNNQGIPKDVFDSKIVEYLVKHMDLMIYNNVLYIYVGGVYVKDKEGRMIKSKIQTLIYDELQTSIRINRVYALLMCTNSLVVTEEETNTYPAHWINFRNGMLDVISGKLKEHSPAYHSMNQIPHDYIVPEREKELTFCKFLESRMNEDDRQMLYEFFALCLNVDMSFQKMMYIVGIGEVGKSLVLEYINHIVGRENVSHISPQNLSQRFQSAFLMHKLLNSVSDISSKAIRESSVIKQLSGEDAIPAEYKGGDVFSFYNTSKMLFSANTVPLVEDEQSNGYYRRLLIARMKQGDYIPNLKENIKKESPEFIYFLTKHLKNVYERGGILESQGSKGEVSMLRNTSDSVQEFVDEVITECQGMNPKKRDVFNYYEKYCIAEKLESVGRNTFYQSMASKGFISGKSNGVEVFRNISISTLRIFLG